MGNPFDDLPAIEVKSPLILSDMAFFGDDKEKPSPTVNYSLGKELARGYAQAGTGIGGAVSFGGSLLDNKSVKEAGKKIKDYWEQVAKDNPRPSYYQKGFLEGMKTNPSGTLATLATESVPQLVMMFAPGGVAGKFFGKAGAMAGTAGSAFGFESGAAFNDAIDSGASEKQAQQYAGAVGLSNMALEMIPGSLFLNRMFGKNKGTGFVRGVINQAFAEGSTESLQEVTSQAWSKIYDPDREMFNRSLFERYIESGVAGGLMGAPMGAISHTKPTLDVDPKDIIIHVPKEDIALNVDSELSYQVDPSTIEQVPERGGDMLSYDPSRQMIKPEDITYEEEANDLGVTTQVPPDAIAQEADPELTYEVDPETLRYKVYPDEMQEQGAIPVDPSTISQVVAPDTISVEHPIQPNPNGEVGVPITKVAVPNYTVEMKHGDARVRKDGVIIRNFTGKTETGNKRAANKFLKKLQPELETPYEPPTSIYDDKSGLDKIPVTIKKQKGEKAGTTDAVTADDIGSVGVLMSEGGAALKGSQYIGLGKIVDKIYAGMAITQNQFSQVKDAIHRGNEVIFSHYGARDFTELQNQGSQDEEVPFQRKGKAKTGGITTAGVKKVFKGGKVTETDSGWHISLPDGSTVAVHPNQVILTPEGGEAYGSIRVSADSLMRLDTLADLETVSHEVRHLLFRRFMTPQEKARAVKDYGSEEQFAEATAQAGYPSWMSNKTVRKVWDFLMKLKDMIIESGAKTERLIRSGEMFNRQRSMAREGVAYQKKDSTNADNVQEETSIDDRPIEEWFQGNDGKTYEAEVVVGSLQEKLQGLFGKRPSLFKPNERAKYDLTVQHADQVMQLYIDLMPTQEQPNRPAEQINKYSKHITPEQRALVNEAANLHRNPKLKELADKILAQDRQIGEQAKVAGVLKDLRVNHLSRFWEPLTKKELAASQRKFGTSTGLARGREFESILQGWRLGRKLRIKGATSALGEGSKKLITAIENKKMIEKFFTMTGKEGFPLFSNEMHEGYVAITHPDFSRRGARYAPAKLAKDINNIWGESGIKEVAWVPEITKVNAVMKAWILQSSFFHHLAYFRSYLLGVNHRKGDTLNPMKAYKEGLQAIKGMEPDIKLLVSQGLTLGKMQDWDEGLLQESTFIGRRIDKMGGITKTVKDRLNAMRDAQAHFLFNELGSGLKAKAALIELANYRKEHPEVSQEQAAKEIARLINEDFGGLHLKRMRRNPTLQHIFRLFALAPDWTESNIRTMAKVIGGTVNKEWAGMSQEEVELYQTFWAGIMLKGLAAYTMMNLIMSLGDDEDYVDRLEMAWKHGDLKWMDIDITPLAKLMGGRADKRYYWSLMGHFEDPAKWITKPLQSVHHKGSVIFKTLYETQSGTNWQGRKFTSLPEAMGFDRQGEYHTTRSGGHKIGDPKGGKYTGQLTKFGTSEPLSYSQIPSYLMSQIKGGQPVQVQNFMSFLLGEMDGVTSIAKSAGLRIRSSRLATPEEKFDDAWNASRNVWARGQALVGEDKVVYNQIHKDEIRKYHRLKLIDKGLSKINRSISKIKSSTFLTDEAKATRVAMFEARKLKLIQRGDIGNG